MRLKTPPYFINKFIQVFGSFEILLKLSLSELKTIIETKIQKMTCSEILS